MATAHSIVTAANAFVAGYCLLAGVLLSSPNRAQGDEFRLPSRLAVNAGIDGDDTRDYTIGLSLNNLPLDASFYLAVVKIENANPDREPGSDSVLVGLASDPLGSMEVGLNYSDWDSSDDFIIESRDLWLRVNGAFWSVTVTLYNRDVFVRLLNRELVAFESTGNSLGADWYGDDDWWVGAEYTTYNYSRDVSLINRTRVLLHLAPAARIYAFGLEDNSTSVWAGGFYENAAIDIEWRRGVSAVDDSATDVLTMSVEQPITDRWTVNGLLGYFSDDTDEGVLFAGIGLEVSW